MTNKPEQLRAFSYLRFSTPEQIKGDSFRRQAALAEEYALRNGLVLDTELTFRDLGVSAFRGKNAETGRLGDFLRAVDDELVPAGSYLLVESLDRISRQAARKAFRILEDIVDRGIVLVTLNDGRAYTKDSLDSDPTSLLMALLTFIRANEESATKGRRLKAAWVAKRLKAGERPLTARAPAWLTLNKVTNKFTVNEDRAAVVRRIFSMAADGKGQHTIAEVLNAEAVPCFGRAKYWNRSYVKKILENSAVIGTLIPHETDHAGGARKRRPLAEVTNYFPAVVDFETYESVASARMTRGTVRVQRSGLVNIFAGLLRCPKCGDTMTRVQKGARSKASFACVRAKQGAGCVYRSVPAAVVTEAFSSQIGEVLGFAPSGNDDLDERFEELQNQQSSLSEQAGNLADQLAQQPSNILSAKLATVEQKLASVDDELRQVRYKLSILSKSAWRRRVSELRRAVEASDVTPERLNVAMRQVFSSIVLDYESGHLELEYKNGQPTPYSSIDYRGFDAVEGESFSANAYERKQTS